MDEKLILKISLIGTIVGIVLLFFISDKVELPQQRYFEINNDENTRVSGIVTEIRKSDKITSFKIMEQNEINVVMFNQGKDIELGDEIEVIGEVGSYQGHRQIIADKVEFIR